MLEHLLDQYLPVLINIIEIIGIIIVITGVFKAAEDYFRAFAHDRSTLEVRHDLCTAMVTGLEFKMAAEILRTVIVRSKDEILMLAAIIVLREVLYSFIKKDMKEYDGKKNGKKITGIKIERE